MTIERKSKREDGYTFLKRIFYRHMHWKNERGKQKEIDRRIHK